MKPGPFQLPALPWCHSLTPPTYATAFNDSFRSSRGDQRRMHREIFNGFAWKNTIYYRWGSVGRVHYKIQFRACRMYLMS